MSRLLLANLMDYAEPVLAIVALVLISSKGQLRKLSFLSAFLAVRALAAVSMLFIIHLTDQNAAAGVTLYPVYFGIFWTAHTVDTLLGFGIVYSVFSQAMAPLQGLHSLGGMMFRWALGISLVVSVTMGLTAHTSGTFLVKALLQLEQAESVLTLCMLMFVTLAIRPMGLSYGSKLFGVNLGLGVLATMDLVLGAITSHSSMFKGLIPMLGQISVCVALCIWTAYFAMPEPRRRMILLPTTSPFLRWNQISLALGDAPGFVAVGDVTLDMFAPAELEVMRRASVKMTGDKNLPVTMPSPIVNRILSTSRELAQQKRQRASNS